MRRAGAVWTKHSPLMPKIFLTHTADMLANYYGPRALAELRKLGEVRLNETGRVLDAGALAEAARGCEIIVSDRQTPGPAEFFRQAADSSPSCGSRSTSATSTSKPPAGGHPGDAGDRRLHPVGGGNGDRHHGRPWPPCHAHHRISQRQGAEPRMGKQLKGATLGILGYGQIGVYLAKLGCRARHAGAGARSVQERRRARHRQVAFEDVLSQSDFVVCLVVANEETENLINAEAFAQMRPCVLHQSVARQSRRRDGACARARRQGHRRRRNGCRPRADQKPSLALAGAPT